LPVLVYALLLREIGILGLTAILLGFLLLAGWSLLFSLFSTDKHEAEVDALLAFVRWAAEPPPDENAGV
jgi:hypothetical protein